MARSIWKGTIAFGLVNVPIELQTTERRNELRFQLVDSRDRAKVRYQRINELTGEPVPWDAVVRAYEHQDDSFVLLSDEDFKQVAAKASNVIEISDFVKQADIDPVYYERPYYLIPGKGGDKGYVLLRETLKRAKAAGIAKVVIRTREYLSALVPRGDALVLMLLRFHEELYDEAGLKVPRASLKELRITPKELDLAEQLVDAMTAPWKPEQYEDEYRSEMLKWIEQKAEKGDRAVMPKGRETDDEATPIFSMAEVLKRSVASRQSLRSTRGRTGMRKRASKRAAQKKRA